VKADAFDELLVSVRQAGSIRRGTLRRARVTKFKRPDIKALRSRLGQSQTEFALMIGVSVGTLRNWEQGRRRPEGPALALLRVVSVNPLLVAQALHGTPKRGAA
jgi:putative transcriptional regulator